MNIDVSDEMVTRHWRQLTSAKPVGAGDGDTYVIEAPDKARVERALRVLFHQLPEDPDKAALNARIKELEKHVVDAQSANERTRSKVADYVGQLERRMASHEWLMEGGRGPYSWDDERYQSEFASASRTLTECLAPLKKLAGDLSECPTDWDAVQAARRSIEQVEAQNDTLTAQVKELEALKAEASDKQQELTLGLSRTLAREYALAAQIKELREALKLAEPVLRMEVDVSGGSNNHSMFEKTWRACIQALSSTPPQDPLGEARNAALEEAAKVLDRRIEIIVDENGHWEPGTNHTNLPEWAETAIEELEERAAEIRSLKGEVSDDE